MVYKAAQINKLEDGWEIKIGDGEKADFSLFVDHITVLDNGDDLSLEDILTRM